MTCSSRLAHFTAAILVVALCMSSCNRPPDNADVPSFEGTLWSLKGESSGVFEDFFSVSCVIDKGYEGPPMMTLHFEPDRRNDQIVAYFDKIGLEDPNDYQNVPDLLIHVDAAVPTTRVFHVLTSPPPEVHDIEDYEEVGDVPDTSGDPFADLPRWRQKHMPVSMKESLIEIERGRFLFGSASGKELPKRYHEIFIHRLRIPSQQVPDPFLDDEGAAQSWTWTLGGELTDLRVACEDVGCLADACYISPEGSP